MRLGFLGRVKGLLRASADFDFDNWDWRRPLAPLASRPVNPALETLLLALREDGAPATPARALLLGAEPHPDFATWPDLTGWQPFKPHAAAWDRTGLHRADAPQGRFPLVMALPGKARDEILAWFALARDHLAPGGTLTVALPNTAGAARFEKEFARACANFRSVQKHKCRAFQATDDGSWDENIFAAWRATGARRTIPGTVFQVEAGVFSADHIDPGSALLAGHLPAHLRGEVADLGAGWGFLTDALLQRCPGVTTVDLFEADARALACARDNLRHYDRSLSFHWHDVCAGLPGTYDAVVMNPPFHQGQDTRVSVGLAFIAAAAGALRRGGTLWLVANRQLPYEAALTRHGLSWRPAGGDATYKLLTATRT